MMACRFTYNGRDYDQDGLAKALAEMHPSEASKYIPGVTSVPSGPYVTKTQDWTDLGLKRALKEAAEGGYDRLTWTPGGGTGEAL